MEANRFLETMSAHVRSGKLPGLVMLVHRRGETRVDTVGAQAFGGAPIVEVSGRLYPIADRIFCYIL